MNRRLPTTDLSPHVYIGESNKRKQAFIAASDELLELWKQLWMYGIENNSLELLRVLGQNEFHGQLHYRPYSPYRTEMSAKDPRIQELVDTFNEFIAIEPLCFIAPRYLTMKHLMHGLSSRLAAAPIGLLH